MARILMPLPAQGYDPTETAIPWRLLSERGHEICFATPDGRFLSARWPGDAHGFALAFAQMIEES